MEADKTCQNLDTIISMTESSEEVRSGLLTGSADDHVEVDTFPILCFNTVMSYMADVCRDQIVLIK